MHDLDLVVVRVLSLSTLAVAVLAIPGCSSDESERVPTVREQVVAAAKQAQEAGFESQYEILRDGVVSEAEYRQAYVDVVTCVEAAGAQASDLELVTGPFGYDYDALFEPGPGQSLDQAGVIADDCQARYQFDVARGWNAQQGGVFEPEYRASLTECLTAGGVKVDESDLTYEDFLEAASPDARDTFGTCLQEMSGLGALPAG